MLLDIYPKIVIATDNPNKAFSLKKRLACRGVFTSILSFDEARRCLEKTDIIILCSDKYSSSAMALIIAIRKSFPLLPTIIFSTDEVAERYKFDNGRCYAYAIFDNCILNTIAEHSCVNVFTVQSQEITTHLYDESYVVYHGTRLYLTETEAALFHYLALSQTCVTAATLANVLAVSATSIPVFVNSINKRSKEFYGAPIIKSKRSHGYYIV